jgi:hypothetical protein
MNKVTFLLSIVFVFLFSSFLSAQCNDESKYTISVPGEKPTIAAAVKEARDNPNFANKKVTIKVAYGVYEAANITPDNKTQKGLLLDRKCLDVIGVPNQKNEKPIIQRGGFTEDMPSIVKIRNSHIRLEGFDIRTTNSDCGYGILILIRKEVDETLTEGFSNIKIVNNTIRDIGQKSCAQAQGIIIWSRNKLKIKDVWVTDNTLTNLQLGSSETITIKNNVEDFHVNNNTIFNVSNIGIDINGFEEESENQAGNGEVKGNTISQLVKGNSAYPHIAGIYVDGGKDTVISGNTVTSFGFGVEIASEKFGKYVSGITVKNNLIYNNLVTGIGIGHGEKQRSYVEKCVISGNTVRDNGIGLNDKKKIIDGGQIHLISHLKDGLKGITIENNYFINTNPKVNEQTLTRQIYMENCLWTDKECKPNKEKVDVKFQNNQFFSFDYTNSMYILGISENVEIKNLPMYFEEFNNNVFRKLSLFQ